MYSLLKGGQVDRLFGREAKKTHFKGYQAIYIGQDLIPGASGSFQVRKISIIITSIDIML